MIVILTVAAGGRAAISAALCEQPLSLERLRATGVCRRRLAVSHVVFFRGALRACADAVIAVVFFGSGNLGTFGKSGAGDTCIDV